MRYLNQNNEEIKLFFVLSGRVIFDGDIHVAKLVNSGL